MKCSFVSVIGMPNAGKSTLINKVVGSKVSIITPKAQTTRNCINGIAIIKDAQVVLIDTPGIFSNIKSDQNALHKSMLKSAWSSLKSADKILVLVDAKRGVTEDITMIMERIKKSEIEKILVLNKIDLVNPPILLELSKKLNELADFKSTFMISALKGSGLEDLKKYLHKSAPEGPWAYPEDDITDVPSRFIASEITREQIFLKFGEEIPYFCSVSTENWEETDKAIKIYQTIYVSRESQKKIVVGKAGAAIKEIGERARKELQKILGKKVHLFLFVKVKSDWMEDPSLLSSI